MSFLRITLVACAILIGNAALAKPDQASFVAVDENLWVTFYDVPSHRFRDIRDAFVRRSFESTIRDLVTSASYLRIESARAIPAIAERLDDVASQMTSISQNIDDPSVTATTLDQLFGRAHWLLAQHYLLYAREARDANRNSLAGKYLWATTHHLERAVLWSNSRIDRNTVKTLDGLRELAMHLQDSDKAIAARKKKPIIAAEKLLIELGTKIERPVVLKPQ